MEILGIIWTDPHKVEPQLYTTTHILVEGESGQKYEMLGYWNGSRWDDPSTQNYLDDLFKVVGWCHPHDYERRKSDIPYKPYSVKYDPDMGRKRKIGI